ncbi:MAG: hypothetical protein EOR45_31310 [Mesorhizobium sp.]|nr:MAG: hypothetical protein EOR45_31310 [Mesorhizobium sp.]
MTQESFASDQPFRPLALGFFIEETNELTDVKPIVQGSDWQQIYAINLLCRQGDFSKTHHVAPILMRNTESLIWSAGVNIIASAGRWEDVQKALSVFQERIDTPWVRYNMLLLLGLSCDLRAVDQLLKIYGRCTDPEEDGDQTLRELSYLLEAATKEIFGGGGAEIEHQRIVNLAAPLRDALSRSVQGTKVFESETFDVVRLATRILAQAENGNLQSERFYRGRLIFEANTGVNCSSFFNELGRPDRLAVMAILEEFFDGNPRGKYQPGQRYFFGHPILP